MARDVVGACFPTEEGRSTQRTTQRTPTTKPPKKTKKITSSSIQPTSNPNRKSIPRRPDGGQHTIQHGRSAQHHPAPTVVCRRTGRDAPRAKIPTTENQPNDEEEGRHDRHDSWETRKPERRQITVIRTKSKRDSSYRRVARGLSISRTEEEGPSERRQEPRFIQTCTNFPAQKKTTPTKQKGTTLVTVDTGRTTQRKSSLRMVARKGVKETRNERTSRTKTKRKDIKAQKKTPKPATSPKVTKGGRKERKERDSCSRPNTSQNKQRDMPQRLRRSGYALEMSSETSVVTPRKRIVKVPKRREDKRREAKINVNEKCEEDEENEEVYEENEEVYEENEAK
ncbi:hypothetical protein DFP72DRAFT_1139005 [Ephemerocybe angulata]|uniref:Uncharacterized protein n=1 Tax=Ephemerocybe angulata TaxID=980116 RepID=A0A8H6HRY4_9AGAR|nr:hypothetical protein DFP72DRAFT_1139005 [Tulosesus angulatus]